jgi:hypothetical protein
LGFSNEWSILSAIHKPWFPSGGCIILQIIFFLIFTIAIL